MDRHDTPDDAAPDAFLRAALRHAPDRELRPSAALSAAIVEAARRSVAPPSPWQWLKRVAVEAFEATRRPPVAGALASLMLGTVIVLMWRDGPPPEALPRTDAPAPRVAAPAAPGREPVTAAVAEREADLSQRAAHAATAAAEAATARQRAAASEVPRRSEKRVAPAAAPVPATTPEPTPPVAETSPPSQGGTPLVRDTGEPAPPAERREDLAKATPSDTAPAAAVPSMPAAPVPVPAPAAATTERTRSGPGAAIAGLTAPASRRATAETAADPLAVLVPARRADAVANAAARLATDAASQAASAWLAELRVAARGRWQSVDPPSVLPWVVLPAHAGAPSPGRVAIDGEAAWWQPADAAADRAWRAPLTPETLARLREAMASWAPGSSGRP